MWAPLALFIMGARLRIEGLDNIKKGQHYVIMANHTSYLDIPVLFRALPMTIHFIGKKELKKVPMLGWYMALSGMIFIDRENAKKARLSILKATKLVRQGYNVVIFPEGTTSETGKIAPFKKGGFVLAQGSQAPILPVRIKGSGIVWPSTSMMNLKSHEVVIQIGKPVPYEEYKDLPLTVNMKEMWDIINRL